MTKNFIRIAIIVIVSMAAASCAGKRNRVYVGQCAVPGHWFCGKVYDSRAACNNDRKRHDFETSMPGTCYSGDPRGMPDNRTM